ncbi:MAG: adenylate kinase [Deltaproteobacteria bacterium]|nr:adenylate kinase [Deltaproteobacteria bacterium]
MKRLVLLGPPGAGKGTQAAMIADHFCVPRISTGDILRNAVREGTALGQQARAHMNRGELLPDSLMMEIVEERLKLPDCKNGFVLDGLPRTVIQAKELEKIVNIDIVVAIDVGEEEVVRRLAGRRLCPICEAGYHVEFKPPRQAEICDRCGTPLKQRDDDQEGVIRNRLKTYREWTAPLLEYYKRKSILRVIDGKGKVEEVFRRIVSLDLQKR